MAIDYTALSATAQTLVEENGRDVTLVKKSEVPLNPTQPWRGNTITEVTQLIKAVMTDYEREDIDGDLIRKGDQLAVVAEQSAPGIAFEDYEILRDDEDQEWRIIMVDKIRPGPTTVLFLIQLRK